MHARGDLESAGVAIPARSGGDHAGDPPGDPRPAGSRPRNRSQIPHIVRAGRPGARDRRRHRLHLDAARRAQRRVSRVSRSRRTRTCSTTWRGCTCCNRVRKVRRLNAVLTNEPAPSATFYLRRDFWMGSLAPAPNPYVGTVEVPTHEPRRGCSATRGSTSSSATWRGRRPCSSRAPTSRGVDRIFLEMHDHVTGLSGVRRPLRDHGRARLRLRPAPLARQRRAVPAPRRRRISSGPTRKM